MVTFGYQRYQALYDCMQYCVVYGYLSYLVVTCGYYVLPALPGIACLLCIVISVTWWVPVVTFGYRCGVTWYCRTLGYIHGVLVNIVTTVTCAITIIVQWIHSIVALPELPLLLVT